MKKFDKVIIMGARGRDFHNFLEYYKYQKDCRVVFFTASPQIAVMPNDTFPARLAGDLYPDGIPIRPESELEELVEKEADKADTRNVVVNFGYSDVSKKFMANVKNRVEALGVKFEWAHVLSGAMIKSSKPVIAVTAVRTGCGKSAFTRKILEILEGLGKRSVAVRHPMPYGDLNNPNNDVQRFASYGDLDFHKCTFEEREEYEPHIENGDIVYAGIDYRKILREAEKEADVIIWDGGNNDVPFYRPDLWITIVDPHRPGDEMEYPHGRYNFTNADIILINKSGSAGDKNMKLMWNSIERMWYSARKHPDHRVAFETDLEITVPEEFSDVLEGKNVITIEDGPTLTHGGMTYGAAVLAAKKYGCELVNPYDYAMGGIKDVFKKYPHLKEVRLLPNMGYSEKQARDMEKTINTCANLERVDYVLSGTPINLSRVMNIDIPVVPVKYESKFNMRVTEKQFLRAISEIANK